MKTVCVFVAMALASAAIAGELNPPGGGVAPTMKDLDDVSPRVAIRNVPGLVAPVEIARDGSYYLAEDIHAIGGEHGIEIKASHVTLDLNGFQVIGSEIGSLDGIHLRESIRNVAIRNGTVRGFAQNGVSGPDSPDVVLEDLRVYDNGDSGIFVGRSMVNRCDARNNGLSGILVGINSTVLSCIAANNGQRGINSGQSCAIQDCTARENGNDGFVVGAWSTITNCSATLNTTRGIRLISGSVATGCSAVGNMTNGIEVQSFSLSCSIINCVAYNNDGSGVFLRDDCVAFGNTCASNGVDGIFVAGQGNRIDSNACNANGDDGVDLDDCANICVRNSLSDNSGSPIEALMCLLGNNRLGALSTDPATAGPWDNFLHDGP